MPINNLEQKLRKLIVGSFSSLASFSIRYPTRVMALAGLVIMVAAPGTLWLKLRTDGHALVRDNAPEVIYDQAIRNQFGIEDQIVVLIKSHHSNGIFNPGTLQLVRELTAEFALLRGINPSNVMSLATEPSFRMRPGTLIHQTLLEP